MEHPLISVIIPTFNTGKYISEAITSVFAQKYPNIEIIVVDDGSTDNTLEVLKTFGDTIKVISQKNTGPAAARNTGLRNARGTIVGLLDADDIWTDDCIESLLPYALSDEYDFARGITRYFKDENGTRIFTDKLWIEVQMGTALYKKTFLDKVGPFDETMHYGEDMDWNMRMLDLGGREKRVEKIVLSYRRHDTNMTNDKERTKNGLLEAFRKRIDRKKTQKLHDKQ